MAWFFAGVAVLGMGWALARFLTRADPALVAGVLRRAVIIFGLVFGVGLAMLGRPIFGAAIITLALFGFLGRSRRSEMHAEEPPKLEHQDPMSRAEACAVLGIAPDADVKDIEAAYARGMADISDKGWGQAERVSQLNRAKAALCDPPA